MRKYLLPLFLILVCMMACNPQKHGKQSQVRELIEQAEAMLEIEDLDSSRALLDQAYSVALSVSDKEGICEACLDIARWNTMMNQLDSTMAWLRRGFPYCEGFDSLRAQYLCEISAAQGIIGNIRKSIDYFRQGETLIYKNIDHEDFAIVCGNIGIFYRRLGMNDSAIFFYHRGIEVAIQANDQKNIAFLNNNLSVLYEELGRHDESFQYAERAENAAKLAGDEDQLLKALAGKGSALFGKGKYHVALDILIPAYQQAEPTHYTLAKLTLIKYILSVLIKKGDKDQQDFYLKKGEELAKTLPPNSVPVLGMLHTKLNINIDRKQWKEALSTIAQIETNNQKNVSMPPYKLQANKARCMAELGHYADAYLMERDAMEMADSERNEQIEKQLNELTTHYKVMEKELEVSKLKQIQADNQRKIGWLIAALSLLLASILVLIMRNRFNRQKNIIRETQKYVEGIEGERTRLARELHDGVCNDLLAIGLQIRAEKTDWQKAADSISTVRNQLRNLSHELMPPQFNDNVNLDEALRFYLEHIEKPTVKYHSEGKHWDQLPTNTAYQIYRITQEAIGNIIVHQPEGTADVTLLYNENELKLNISSKGEIVESRKPGIGLQSMRDRANSIHGKMETHQSKDLFVITVNIPS